MKLIDILVEELPKRGGWPEGVSKISSTSCGRVFFDGQSPHGFTLPVASDAWDSHKHPFSYTNAVTREQYEAALAAKNDGWIDWGGGKHPPVSTNTFVDVKLENGDVQSALQAGEYSWEHVWQGSNIIAYRLHKPTKSEQVRADAWNAYAGITEADDETDLNECIGQGVAPVWNGEGLPPVGCECEIKFIHDTPPAEWFSFKLIGVHEEIVIITLDGENTWRHISTFSPDKVTFRPIRSEAERKREEAVKAITLTGWCQNAAEEIYDLVAAGKVPGMKLEG